MMPAEVSMFPCRKFAAPLMFGTWPNTIGQLHQLASGLTLKTGVFSGSVVTHRAYTSILGTDQDEFTLDFNASNGNAIYGGTTVQPKALNCLPCIRI